MPRHDGVDILEEPGAHHVDLARAAFFGRRAVVAQRAGCARDASHSFTATAAASAPVPSRLWPQPWPGAFSSIAWRCAVCASCDNPGSASNSPTMPMTGLPEPNVATNAVGMSATPRCHLEAGGLQLLLQQRAALRLLIADLGEAPDLLRDGGVAVALRVDAAQQRGAIVALCRTLAATTGRSAARRTGFRRIGRHRGIQGFGA